MQKLYYLNNIESDDAAFNLALEEYLFFKRNEKRIFSLWQNRNAVIIGRNQITENEIDCDLVQRHAIQVIRRMSGGGAVYHDLGNLNFSCITNINDKINIYYIIGEVLRNYGLEIEVSGRNDILVDNKKFSGNAFFENNGRYLHHGTILVNLNQDMASKVLTPKVSKLKSKGVKSVKSRIVNLDSLLSENLDINRLREDILSKLQTKYLLEPLVLTEDNYTEISRLADEKYRTISWNYRKHLSKAYSKELKFEQGLIEVHLNLENNIIKDIEFTGDFFNLNDIHDLEKYLLNTKIKNLRGKILDLNIRDYILGLDTKTFLSLFEEIDGF